FWLPQLGKEIRQVGDPPSAQALERATFDEAGLADGLNPGPKGQEPFGFVRLANQRLSTAECCRLLQGGDQTRFAIPGLDEQRDHLTMALTRFDQRLGQSVDLRVASDQRGCDGSRATLRAKASASLTQQVRLRLRRRQWRRPLRKQLPVDLLGGF